MSRLRTAGRARSLLYVPGHSEKMLRKANTLTADLVVFDLEDGVHPQAKEPARERVHDVLRESWASPSRRFVRPNGLDTPWGKGDLEMMAGTQTPLVIPKAESTETVAEILSLAACREALLMIETPLGVLNAPELARMENVAGLVFGSADYRAAMGMTGSSVSVEEDELDLARQSILLAARAARCSAIDAPWFDFRDRTGLARSSRRAKEMGFDGKSAIHPGQIPVIHSAFRPTEKERQWAERVRDTLSGASELGNAVAVLDGILIEAPHLRLAERLLQWEEAFVEGSDETNEPNARGAENAET